MAQVADIVEQGGDQPDRGSFGTELVGWLVLAFKAHHEPRHRQRDIQCVLGVVIERVDAFIVGGATGEEFLEAPE